MVDPDASDDDNDDPHEMPELQETKPEPEISAGAQSNLKLMSTLFGNANVELDESKVAKVIKIVKKKAVLPLSE